MALFDKMKDSISVASQGVSQKAKNATESMKIGNQIKANERMIEKLTHQVGVQCVKNHVNETNTEYAELFSEILRLREENAGLQMTLQTLAVGNVCPQCGFSNNQSAKFCISCGNPLNMAQSAAAGGRQCAACGSWNAEDAMFCTECGQRLGEAVPAAPIEAPANEPVMVQEEAPVNEPIMVQEEAPANEPVMVQEEAPVNEPVTVQEEAPVNEPVTVQEEVLEKETEEKPEEIPVDAGVEVSETGKRCKSCGAMVEEDSLFCTECGTRLE